MPPLKDNKLSIKQKIFCEEYIIDWNATRAALKAGYSKKTAYSIGNENLTKPEIQQYINKIQKELEKQAGISRLKIVMEHKKMAFSSISHLHNTWIQRKEFEELTQDQKDCIEEIDTKIKKFKVADEIIEIEYIKIKLYDKQKSLDAICKILGYNEPEEKNIKFTPISEIPLIKWIDESNTDT